MAGLLQVFLQLLIVVNTEWRYNQHFANRFFNCCMNNRVKIGKVDDPIGFYLLSSIRESIDFKSHWTISIGFRGQSPCVIISESHLQLRKESALYLLPQSLL